MKEEREKERERESVRELREGRILKTTEEQTENKISGELHNSMCTFQDTESQKTESNLIYHNSCFLLHLNTINTRAEMFIPLFESYYFNACDFHYGYNFHPSSLPLFFHPIKSFHLSYLHASLELISK